MTAQMKTLQQQGGLLKFFQKRRNSATYPVYSTANAILGLKKAYEKARLTKLQRGMLMADVTGVQDE